MTDRKPLRCIVCDVQPDPCWTTGGGTYQPHGATMFDAGGGHYGSTVWDTMSRHRSLTVNVCDECLVARKDRVAVVVQPPPAERPEAQFIPWDVES